MHRSNRLVVEEQALEALRPDPRNARTHCNAQVELIDGSMAEFRWTNPILVYGDGAIIAG